MAYGQICFNDSSSRPTSAAIADVISNVYGWMTLALLVTAGVAYLSLMYIVRSLEAGTFSMVPFWTCLGLELLIVLFFDTLVSRLSFGSAFVLFMVYSALQGYTLGAILLLYTGESIVATFIITACTFGIMAIIGHTTKKDLSVLGGLLAMALIGLVIATLVNMILNSSALNYIISYVGVVVFVGLTAWDAHKIRQTLEMYEDYSSVEVQKEALIGSLCLYLDFVNLFLYLLRFTGRRR